MRSICVFCGANFNGDPALKQAVELLAEVMVSKHISLVYGGGNVGVMGLLADAVLGRGGEVIGIIPQFLMDKEVGHKGITKLHIVDNMHQRKQMMNDLCDGIIMLPGGFGTLEEFFEVLTWLQLGLHKHPVGILNVGGFYDALLTQMDVMVEQRYLKPANRELVLTSVDPIELVDLMEKIDIKPDEVWFRDRNLT
ncbi:MULTISPECIES: TIGR00730 family Rossman fold protein [unclassified Mucilaginibacter]|uniref:LOG family protein n=1 Tax=unclassified Mucilaginibacter TaxID=2617802 RepID=UPI002AC8C718|nr:MULTISPECIES: TIGR00730 family Rossman fold protein [unclassified Mucilaginibacter]MEB0248644.1 TIGR00730 family Rossman fold protein [Mucilaginibacter sp. 5B2]MEB0260391.1 TIGR00730 family Rossman fold protein [Mucilaginibacter sp. 10I4]MEB0279430.1 TIGR00730 family Rossman fold protein [Mucilaginibacter sp. 10B2]MEB0299990.1 TIGR00730 family Rossman fold protein [Mucilaginibacter sp. 5C4]WPX21804.1 TIGR00730 family Rossman fold protein [Mucilaginibacter sp. 5C4]